MTIYVPSENGDVLVNKDLKEAFGTEDRISLTEHFYLAMSTPILSLLSPMVIYPPGPQYTLYPAVRLASAVNVEGIHVIGYNDFMDVPRGYGSESSACNSCQKFIHTNMTTLPLGSILLQDNKRQWYGLTPYEEKLQNPKRIEYTPSSDGTPLKFSPSRAVSSANEHTIMITSVLSWNNPEQRHAHLQDIEFVRRNNLRGQYTNIRTQYMVLPNLANAHPEMETW